MPPIIQLYSLIQDPSEKNDWVGMGTAQFTAQLQAAEASGEAVAQVRINSVGGNWVIAQGMFGMMKASPLKIDTYNDGIAASSASLVFMAGRKRLMSAHARLMIHNCSGPAGGQIVDLEKAIAGQRAINESMAAVYAAATGLELSRIVQMMEDETWLSADEALALGFATGIINNDKKALAAPAELNTTAQLQQLQAYYSQHLPSLNSNMKNLLFPIMAAAAVADITATSTDEQYVAGISAMATELTTLRAGAAEHATALGDVQAKLETAEAEKEQAEQKVAALEKEKTDAEAAAKEKEASDLVSNAVAVGKITAEAAPSYLALAAQNIGAVQAVLEKLPAKKSLTEQVIAQGEGSQNTGKITAAGMMAEINLNAGTAKKAA
jgi:ATP-dependent protease ClpP protease subunit